MEIGRLVIPILLLSFVTVGFSYQSAFAGFVCDPGFVFDPDANEGDGGCVPIVCDPGFVFDPEAGDGGECVAVQDNAGSRAMVEAPTIGTYEGTGEQVVKNGFCWDATCYNINKFWHQEIAKIDAHTSPHTVTLTILPSGGVQTLTDVTIGMAPIGAFDIKKSLWSITAHRDTKGPGGLMQKIQEMQDPGKWKISINDPQDYIGDVVTLTVQVTGNGKYVVMGITTDLKKPTDTNYALGIQVTDDRKASRNFWMNEGVEVTDSWKYPTVQTAYETSLDIPRVCTSDEDSSDRITCTFADRLDEEIAKAQATFAARSDYNIKHNFEE